MVCFASPPRRKLGNYAVRRRSLQMQNLSLLFLTPRVVTSRDNDSFYAGVLLWSCATFVVVGISLVIGWRAGVSRELGHSAIVTKPPTVGQNFQWAQKLPLRRPIVGIPAFGLLAAMVFAILAILVMMLTGAFQYKSKGFWVHLLKPGAAPAKPLVLGPNP